MQDNLSAQIINDCAHEILVLQLKIFFNLKPFQLTVSKQKFSHSKANLHYTNLDPISLTPHIPTIAESWIPAVQILISDSLVIQNVSPPSNALMTF